MDRHVFLEIGACTYPALACLLHKDWKQSIKDLDEYDRANVPDELLIFDREWEGWLIEPVPSHFNDLLANTQHFPNAHHVQAAVHGDSAFRTLGVYINEAWEHQLPLGSLVYLHHHAHKRLQTFTLKTITLDELLDHIGKVPTFIRMDVEGSERSILESFSWTRLPQFWQIDTHGENTEWMTRLLRSKGFDIVGTTLGSDGEEIWARMQE